MGRRNKGGRRRKKDNRQRGGNLTKQEKEAQLSESMAKVHELFIKMEEQFKGCTISGVAIDSNTGAVCVHVEEHNKVLMFYATDFSIAEHAGKLRDMLLAAGFLVPEPVMETWNQEFTDMATAYAKAVMAGEDADPEKVDAERIKLILGSYYSPEQAHEELAKLTGKNEKDVAEDAAAGDAADAADAGDVAEEPEPEESKWVLTYRKNRSEVVAMEVDDQGDSSDAGRLRAEMIACWDEMSAEERKEFEENVPA